MTQPLRDYLDADLDSQVDVHAEREKPDGERFKVDGPRTAEWALRKLARIRGYLAENDQIALEEIKKITDWITDANAALGADAAFFEGLLEDWHRRELADDPARKSIKLPNGTLKSRKTPEGIEVTDADALIDWAEANGHPEIRRVKVEVDKVAARKVLGTTPEGQVFDPSTGEIVPGVEGRPSEVRYSVDTGAKE